MAAYLVLIKLSLINRDRNFKELLSLFDLTARADNQLRIQAIKTIQTKTVTKFYRGVMLHGILYQLEIDEQGFISCADIYLFGCIIKNFFKQYITLNYFFSLKIVCYPSNKEFEWTSDMGQNKLI